MTEFKYPGSSVPTCDDRMSKGTSMRGSLGFSVGKQRSLHYYQRLILEGIVAP